MEFKDPEKFYLRCIRYAQSRRAPRERVEEFPAYAWDKLYIKKWKTNLEMVWKNFVRDQLGPMGGNKSKIVSAVHFRRAYLNDQDKSDFLENVVAAPDPDFNMRFRTLPKRQQMIIILLEAGFSMKEICGELLKKSPDHEGAALQRELIQNKEFKEIVGNRRLRVRADVAFSVELSQKRRAALKKKVEIP